MDADSLIPKLLENQVIDFPSRRKAKEPHREGKARCLNCKHEWEAVAPVGICSLECPNCLTTQGVFKGISATEFKQFQCVCGEFYYFIDEHGSYCAHCGTRPSF